MTHRPFVARLGAAAFLLATLLALLAGSAPAGAEDFAVVANPNIDVTNLEFDELRKIMLADRQFWPSGQKVVLIVRAPVSEERTVLLEKVFQMSEDQYRQYWIAKVFRAEATAEPRIVLSSGEILELIGVIPGAVAIVSAEDVPAGLSVIEIDGLRPGDEGYPLRSD
jgi:hypothetical protein